MIGMILEGRYKLKAVLGKGGTGSVYLAEDLKIGKEWAVKRIVFPKEDKNEVNFRAFCSEISILRKAEHKNLPRIADLVETKQSVYLIMDYVRGESIAEYIERQGFVSEPLAVAWGIKMMEVIRYFHNLERPVIYGDLKPSNILVEKGGELKLIDFGTAKEGREEDGELAFGTRGYAAPEQYGDRQGRRFKGIDQRTDLYAFGATMYHMLTGLHPGSGKMLEQGRIRCLPPGISEGLEYILKNCLQEEPEKRYPSAEALLADLKQYKSLGKKQRRKEKVREGVFLGLLFSGAFAFLAALLGSLSILLPGMVSAAKNWPEYFADQSNTISKAEYIMEEGARRMKEWKELIKDKDTPLYEIEIEYGRLLAKEYQGFAKTAEARREDYYRKALGCFEEILEISRAEDREVRGACYYDMAVIYEKLGESRRAEEYYQKGEDEIWQHK